MEGKKISMDNKQISMLCTESEQIYTQERAGKVYFQDDNIPDRVPSVVKEPAVNFIAAATYPLSELFYFLKLAKGQKATHVKIELARRNAPARLGFESLDKLNQGNGNSQVETHMWLAPRIEDRGDSVDVLTFDELTALIAAHESELVYLKARLEPHLTAKKNPDPVQAVQAVQDSPGSQEAV